LIFIFGHCSQVSRLPCYMPQCDAPIGGCLSFGFKFIRKRNELDSCGQPTSVAEELSIPLRNLYNDSFAANMPINLYRSSELVINSLLHTCGSVAYFSFSQVFYGDK
jgi:hypothetical protein